MLDSPYGLAGGPGPGSRARLGGAGSGGSQSKLGQIRACRPSGSPASVDSIGPVPDFLMFLGIAAVLFAAANLVQTLRLSRAQERPPTQIERPVAPAPRPDAAGAVLFRLAGATTDEWTGLRAQVWEARDRWFAEPAYRRKLLSRLVPGGGQAPVPKGRYGQAIERWLLFLAGLAEGARDADAREAIAGVYAPWRGFCIDLCRAVEEVREGLSEREARQLPAPAWFEPLRRLDAAAFPDTAHDFTAHVHDRQLMERESNDGSNGD